MRTLPGAGVLLALLTFAPAHPARSADLDACLMRQGIAAVARVRGPGGERVYARVVDSREGIPRAVVPLGDASLELAAAFERAGRPPAALNAPVWRIDADAARICAPVALAQAEIDAEARVVVAAGLNYAAHAEEAGGGEVFLFPKPVEPTAAYGEVRVPKDVVLLDYEVELAFVLLADIDLGALPDRETLLASTAFFVANDVSDREPIIREKALFGPGLGFVEGKGQPGFLPLGPWMVRGSELFAALAGCGAEGLGIRLAVDQGEGFQVRQQGTTARMILDPAALLERIAEVTRERGLRTSMPVRRAGGVRHYPMALEPGNGSSGPRLPAGSVVVTGTPDGVALQAPPALPLVLRGLRNLRSPTEQFRLEQRARAASGERGGYLRPGDRVRASIDGLGTQLFRIGEPGAAVVPDACAEGAG